MGYQLVIIAAGFSFTDSGKFIPGHLAYAVSGPEGTAYFGFGPAQGGNPSAPGEIDMEFVPPGASPSVGTYANAFGDQGWQAYQIPITADQYYGIIQGVFNQASNVPYYNGLTLPSTSMMNVCTTDFNQVLTANGIQPLNPYLGPSIMPSVIPGGNAQWLSAIADQLAVNPNATSYQIADQSFQIPEQWRGLTHFEPKLDGDTSENISAVFRNYDPESYQQAISAFGPPSLTTFYSQTNGVISPDRLNVASTAWLTDPASGEVLYAPYNNSAGLSIDLSTNPQYQQATSTFGAPSLNTFSQPVQGVQDYPYGAVGGAQPSPLENSLANYQQAVSTFGTATSIDNSLQPIQSVQLPGSAEGVDGSPYGSIAQDTNAGSQSAQVAEATSSFGTPSVTTYSEPSQGVSYGGYYGGGGGYGGGSDDEEPVVLDLTGKGINITQETSSNTFFDGAGDGEQHQTAWAGAGNAVLFYDPTGTGSLTRADQVVFTDLDPSASNDMQALEDVFDTNHNGSLDAGDASYGNFYLDVTNANGTHTIESLTQAGITAINLTTNAVNQKLPDGSAIQGETTYTTSSGSTGAAATVSFAADATGYAVASTAGATRRNRACRARARRRVNRDVPRGDPWRFGHKMQPENLIEQPCSRRG